MWQLSQLQLKLVGLGGKEWVKEGEERRRLPEDGAAGEVQGRRLPRSRLLLRPAALERPPTSVTRASLDRL